MKFFRISLLATVCWSMLFFNSCNEDEDPPMEMVQMPVAQFTYSADELTVTFNNSSENATSFEWDFGDGSMSFEQNPVHLYTEGGSYTVSLKAINGSQSDTETMNIDVMDNPENVRRKSGIVIVGRTPENTFLAKYFDELPSSDIDLTDGTAFQVFDQFSVSDGAMFGFRTDGSPGIGKLAVNGNNEFVEDGVLSTTGPAGFSVSVKDNEYGLFLDPADPSTSIIFNPSNMEVTGSIDMSMISSVSSEPVGVQHFFFRDDEIFGLISSNPPGAGLPPVGMPLAVFNSSASSVESITISNASGTVNVFPEKSKNYVDESGNIYFVHSGDLRFPTESGAILKINSGSQSYDPDYNFKVPDVANSQVINLGSFMVGFEYIGNNKAVSLINTEVQQSIIDLVDQKGGVENFSDDDWNFVAGTFFTVPSARFVLIDLVEQTVEPISGLPVVSIFGGGSITFINDELYLAAVSPTSNTIYKYNSSTVSATPVVNVSGAILSEVIDLSDDF